MKVLIVLTSHDKLGASGKKTGFWLEEFAAPYYKLKDAGMQITLASPNGGQPPIAPPSLEDSAQTDSTKRFLDDQAALDELAHTAKLSEMKEQGFDAVFYPGGHGPMWDLYSDKNSIALIEAFIKAGKPIAAICHAPAALLMVKNPDGKLYLTGKKVTGLSNEEEGSPNDVPFLLEDQLIAAGAEYQKVAKGKPLVVIDGQLITGQNPASSEEIAKALIKKLKRD